MDLHSQNVQSLKSLAKERGLKNYSKMNKQSLLELLGSSQTPQAPLQTPASSPVLKPEPTSLESDDCERDDIITTKPTQKRVVKHSSVSFVESQPVVEQKSVDLTTDKLRALLTARGMTGLSKMKKQDLLAFYTGEKTQDDKPKRGTSVWIEAQKEYRKLHPDAKFSFRAGSPEHQECHQIMERLKSQKKAVTEGKKKFDKK